MFTQLRIQNFKSWADTGDFRMAPLTGFFGTNSSGKTAILQFLLMLKQTVESSDRQRILHLGGDQYSYVDLGTTYNIIHRHQLPQKIKFQFKWIPKYINTPSLRIPYMMETSLLPEHLYTLNNNNPLMFESVVSIEEDQITLDLFKYTFKVYKYAGEDYGLNHIIVTSYMSNNGERAYNLSKSGKFFEAWEALTLSRGQIFSKTKEIESSHVLKNYGISYDVDLSDLTANFEDLFQNTYYLAPLREYPRRTYQWSGETPQGVGNRGELAAAALLTSRKKNLEVEASVAKALKELGLIHSFRLNKIAQNRGDYEVLVQNSPNSPEVLITDVGFGVSQILPILVLCYYAPKGATLIFEQPEIHLHPSVQAGLADVFIDAIRTRNIQIIIESHSEHLLSRLQRRIAEEKDGFTNEDAALYFCNMSEEGDSKLIPLELDPFGNINNWPDGFFGDTMGDLVAMTEASMKRQMND